MGGKRGKGTEDFSLLRSGISIVDSIRLELTWAAPLEKGPKHSPLPQHVENLVNGDLQLRKNATIPQSSTQGDCEELATGRGRQELMGGRENIRNIWVFFCLQKHHLQ